MTTPIGGQDGNWTQLRRLIMHLLEEHEEAIDGLKELIEGTGADDPGLKTRIAVIETKHQKACEELKVVQRRLNRLPADSKSKLQLVGVLTVMSAALGKLIELVVHLLTNSGGTGTP